MKTKLRAIQDLRVLHLQSMNTQIRYNAVHERGWSDSWLLRCDDANVGYGSIKGRDRREDRDTIFEFFVIRPFETVGSDLFRTLLAESGARYIECQSNDAGLAALMHEFARDIASDVVLFEDHAVTHHVVPGAVVRPRHRSDRIFEHTMEPAGEYVLELDGEIVATGGFTTHYNPPFADLYMEVREDCRRRGLATFLLQEVKKACYLAGRVPAARCSIVNAGSRGALTKAGLRVSGFMLSGVVRDAAERR